MYQNDISSQKNAFRPKRVDVPPKGMVKKKNEKNVKRLMRKVMAVVIAAATIFSISGGTKVVPGKAAVEVAEVLDETGMKIAGYTTFEVAARNVYNNYTIKMLADATEPCSVDIGNKNLTIDLNDKNLTITQISTMNALTIKNGSMSAEIDNANVGNDPVLTLLHWKEQVRWIWLVIIAGLRS